MTSIQQFFARYEQGANSFDPDLVCSLYTTEFLGADPNGVACFKNEDLPEWLAMRHSFFQQIGFQSAKVLALAEMALDEHYTMARVHWQMVFEKEPGCPLDFKFHITYFLFDSGSGPKVAFWVSHDDELKVMQEAGLIAKKMPNK